MRVPRISESIVSTVSGNILLSYKKSSISVKMWFIKGRIVMVNVLVIMVIGSRTRSVRFPKSAAVKVIIRIKYLICLKL